MNDSSKYVWVCFRCGAPLKKEHVAFQLSGPYIKFNEREVGEVTIYSCGGCLDFFNEIVQGGVRKAVEKWEGINGVVQPA